MKNMPDTFSFDYALTRPQSSLLRKERSARGEGGEGEGVMIVPPINPVGPTVHCLHFPSDKVFSHHPSRFSPFSRETTGDESGLRVFTNISLRNSDFIMFLGHSYK